MFFSPREVFSRIPALWNMAATEFAVLNLRLLGRNNDSFR
jgi:hypothetical protein